MDAIPTHKATPSICQECAGLSHLFIYPPTPSPRFVANKGTYGNTLRMPLENKRLTYGGPSQNPHFALGMQQFLHFHPIHSPNHSTGILPFWV